MKNQNLLGEEERRVRTGFGEIRIRFYGDKRLLVGVSIEDPSEPGSSAGKGAAAKILEELRLPEAETPFLRAVRRAVSTIPPGETVTYGELARQVGARGAARAVGRAMARNPFALIVPCHRVVPASGGFGGYRWGSGRKEALLQLERETGLDAWRVL